MQEPCLGDSPFYSASAFARYRPVRLPPRWHWLLMRTGVQGGAGGLLHGDGLSGAGRRHHGPKADSKSSPIALAIAVSLRCP